MLECLGGLSLAGRLQSFVLLADLQPHNAWLDLRPRTAHPKGTRRTVLACKTRLERHPTGGIRVRQPRDALLPAGQVTTCRSQSTTNWDLSKPVPHVPATRGRPRPGRQSSPHSAVGYPPRCANRCTPYPPDARSGAGCEASRTRCTTAAIWSSGVVAGVVSTFTIRWGVFASQVSVKWTLYPIHSIWRLVL